MVNVGKYAIHGWYGKEGYFDLCNVNIQTTWGRYQLSLGFFFSTSKGGKKRQLPAITRFIKAIYRGYKLHL